MQHYFCNTGAHHKLMVESNLYALDINLVVILSDDQEEVDLIQVSEIFPSTPRYSDIIYVLQNLNPSLGMSKTKRKSLRLKASKYCIMDNALYWKDPGGVLLNGLAEDESKEVINDFHKGDYGRHLYWKTKANKLLRVGYYWPTLFAYIYKVVMSCHECQVFQSKRKLLPLPLQPISINAPFQ